MVELHGLSDLGLCIHTNHKIIICKTCRSGCLPQRIPDHIRTAHAIVLHRRHVATLIHAVMSYDLVRPLGPFVLPLLSIPVQGIAVHPHGIVCNLCLYCTPLYTLFTRHWSMYHTGFLNPPWGRYITIMPRYKPCSPLLITVTLKSPIT